MKIISSLTLVKFTDRLISRPRISTCFHERCKLKVRCAIWCRSLVSIRFDSTKPTEMPNDKRWYACIWINEISPGYNQFIKICLLVFHLFLQCWSQLHIEVLLDLLGYLPRNNQKVLIYKSNAFQCILLFMLVTPAWKTADKSYNWWCTSCTEYHYNTRRVRND